MPPSVGVRDRLAALPGPRRVLILGGGFLAGAGDPIPGTTTQVASTDPTLVVHEHYETPVAVTGLDAVALAQQWVPRLHQPQHTLDAEN